MHCTDEKSDSIIYLSLAAVMPDRYPLILLTRSILLTNLVFVNRDIYIYFLRDYIFKKTLFEKLQYLKQEQ